MARMWDDERPEEWKLKRQFTKGPGILPTQTPRALLLVRKDAPALSVMNLSPPLPPSDWKAPQEDNGPFNDSL